MAEILPFIGTRYNSQLIGNLGKVLAPPYEMISPEQQMELYARHDYNVVRLELNMDQAGDDEFSNRYSRAANTLKTWRSDGILIEDEKPSFYLYEQEFKLPTGEALKRRGFFALAKLEEHKKHANTEEQSLNGMRADRLKLLRATHANLSPIFVVYNDPERRILNLLSQKMTDKPWEEVVDDEGVIHRLWVVQKKEFIVALQEAMKDQQLYIADGHHRYETALRFRDEMREATGKTNGKQPFDYTMMYLTDAEQEGLVILPTHRALTRSFVKEINLAEAIEELAENFDLEEEEVDLDQPQAEAERLLRKVSELGEQRTAFAMILGSGKVYYLQLQEGVDAAEIIDDEELGDEVKRLDVSVLHHYIINQVMVGNPEFELEDDECIYVRDAVRVLELLKQKKASLAFLLNPVKLEQVIAISRAGQRIPMNSADFHPKIISGFVIRNMDCEAKKPAAPKKPTRA